MRARGPGCPHLSPWHLALKHFARCPQQPTLETFSLEPCPVLQGGTGLAYQDVSSHKPVILLRSNLHTQATLLVSGLAGQGMGRSNPCSPSEVYSRDDSGLHFPRGKEALAPRSQLWYGRYWEVLEVFFPDSCFTDPYTPPRIVSECVCVCASVCACACVRAHACCAMSMSPFRAQDCV